MFNPIFKATIQRGKQPKSSAFAEPELRSYRKCSPSGNEWLQNPKDSHNYHDENHDEI